MSAELLSVRPAESDTTLVLKLSNPGARNALHPDMYAAGIEAMNTAERDTSVRAIVLTGADNFFCAGGKIPRCRQRVSTCSGNGSWRCAHRRNR